MRYLGIDFGEKRMGLAMSDPGKILASPFKTLAVKSLPKAINELAEIAAENEVEKIILGLPITMKGADSEKTTLVREFAEKLKQKTKLPVEFMDERLTSIQAHQTMHMMGKKPSRNKEKVDQLAAQYILQTFLDREKNRSNYGQ